MIQRLDRIPAEENSGGTEERRPFALEGEGETRVAETLVREASAAGFQVQIAERHLTVESRYDTQWLRFERAGLRLAVRSVDGRHSASLENAASGAEPRPGTQLAIYTSAPNAVKELRERSDAFGTRLRLLTGDLSLELQWTLRTLTTTYLLGGPAGSSLTLELTEHAITLPREDRARTMVRLKSQGDVAPRSRIDSVLQAVQASCGLRLAMPDADDDRAAAALVPPTSGPDFGSVELSEHQPAASLAYAMLRRNFQEILLREPGARLGVDVEELHRMRVALRRLRAIMRLLRAYLPARVRSLRNGFRWIARVLAPVRDLDVELAQLRQWELELPAQDHEGLRPIEELLERRRQRARGRMLRALDSGRYDRFIARAGAQLRAGAPPHARSARIPALVAAPVLLEELQKRVVRDGTRATTSAAPERCHALRLRAKALRYALDACQHLYGEPARKYASQLARLQDTLGQHQDAVIAVARLRALATGRRPKLTPSTAFMVGVFTERYSQLAALHQQRIPREVRKLAGKRWRRLAKTMRAPRAGAADTRGMQENRAGVAPLPVRQGQTGEGI